MLSSLETSISPREGPLLISLSVIEACRECSKAYLSGADPINHSTLHRFRCDLALHLPYSEHPRGGSPPPLSHRLLQSWGHVELSVTAHICLLSLCFSSPLCPLSVLSFCAFSLCPVVVLFCLFVFFVYLFLHRGGCPGCVLCVWHVLMLTELPLSENVTI